MFFTRGIRSPEQDSLQWGGEGRQHLSYRGEGAAAYWSTRELNNQVAPVPR